MPDTLAFGGQSISGQIFPLQLPSRRHVVFRTSFPGLDGVSELQSGKGGRVIPVRMLIADPSVQIGGSASALSIFITNTLQRDLIGAVGNLTLSTAANWPTFANVTYDGFQKERGPLPDVADTLESDFFAIGTFLFFQRR